MRPGESHGAVAEQAAGRSAGPAEVVATGRLSRGSQGARPAGLLRWPGACPR